MVIIYRITQQKVRARKVFFQKVKIMKLNNIIKIAIFGAAIIAIIALSYNIDSNLFLAHIKHHSGAIFNIINQYYVLSSIAFIFTIAFCTFFGIPLGIILSMAAGYFFGSIQGTIYAVMGSTLGASAAFLAVRHAFYHIFEVKYGEKLIKVRERIKKRGASYILAMHFMPATPFFLINIFAGLSSISLATFASATAVGLIPGTLVYAIIGRKLGTVNSVKDLLSPTIIALFIILSLLSLTPLIYDYITMRRKPKQ